MQYGRKIKRNIETLGNKKRELSSTSEILVDLKFSIFLYHFQIYKYHSRRTLLFVRH